MLLQKYKVEVVNALGQSRTNTIAAYSKDNARALAGQSGYQVVAVEKLANHFQYQPRQH